MGVRIFFLNIIDMIFREVTSTNVCGMIKYNNIKCGIHVIISAVEHQPNRKVYYFQSVLRRLNVSINVVCICRPKMEQVAFCYHDTKEIGSDGQEFCAFAIGKLSFVALIIVRVGYGIPSPFGGRTRTIALGKTSHAPVPLYLEIHKVLFLVEDPAIENRRMFAYKCEIFKLSDFSESFTLKNRKSFSKNGGARAPLPPLDLSLISRHIVWCSPLQSILPSLGTAFIWISNLLTP